MRFYLFCISFVVFILPTLLTFSFQVPIKNALMKEAVVYTAEQVTTFAHSREVAIEEMFKKLPLSLDYKCNIDDISKIREPKYYTLYIRMLGIITVDKSCSSSGFNYKSAELDSVYKQSRNGLYIFPTPHGGNEYVVAQKSDNGVLYAILNNSWIDQILVMICDGCFNVNIYSNIDNSRALIVKGHGERTVLVDGVNERGGHFNVFVSPTKLLLYKMSNWYHRFAYFISLIFGGVFLCLWLCLFTFLRKPMSLKNTISKALDSKEFIPYYQPIIDSFNNEIIGAEILVRWVQPSGEVISPSSFINEIESDSKMLLQLTKQLIEQVCNDKQSVNYLSGLWFSINIGAQHFMSNDLLDYMNEMKDVSGGISFEITERQPLHDFGAVASYVDELKRLGHEIKIDDFGVGYGGFSYLQKINVDAIKIDKMFIDTIGTDDIKKKVLDSIIAMAIEHNYEIIAEGVENIEQVEYLSNKNVRLIQGYYYSAPVAFEDFLILIKQMALR